VTRAGSPAPDDAARARAVRGLALAARSLEQAAGDLTLAQYRVLAYVAAGAERSSLVARGLALAKPTVTATVDGLVERTLLTREAVEGDRRSLRLAVTRAGEAALRSAEQSMGERLAEIVEFAGDPAALLATLADLDDAVAARMHARIQQRADPEARTVASPVTADTGPEVEAPKQRSVTT
jgi:DNA-binding MarR family transcriptional regulator